MRSIPIGTLLLAAILFVVASIGTLANSAAQDSQITTIKLTSGGPLAFGPDGLLLVSDPMQAKIYAIETADTAGSVENVTIDVEDVRSKVAGAMGTTSDDVRINDLAVNPINGNTYLNVTRGSGADELTAIFKIEAGTTAMSPFKLEGLKFTQAELPNAAESKQTRGGDQRLTSITDMAFVDGQVYVAGLSNEEFASNLRAIPYPFEDVNKGASIEVYHGAHGKFETRSPIRTFASYMVEDELNLLAAYTCTPLVRIPVGQLQPEAKVKGTTIAELGNRNRPLDMVVYKKGGKDYALMANSDRGVMKIDLAKVAEQQPIVTPVPGGGTKGLPYETINSLVGVMQLDGLNATHGVILVRDEDGKEHIRTIVLP